MTDLVSCATAVFEGKNEKLNRKMDTYIGARVGPWKGPHFFVGSWSFFSFEILVWNFVRSFFDYETKKFRTYILMDVRISKYFTEFNRDLNR